jgi:hypothetical protein
MSILFAFVLLGISSVEMFNPHPVARQGSSGLYQHKTEHLG